MGLLVGTLSLTSDLLDWIYRRLMWLVLLREAICEVWGQPEENERVPKRDRGNRGSSTYIETSSHPSEWYMPSYPYDGE